MTYSPRLLIEKTAADAFRFVVLAKDKDGSGEYLKDILEIGPNFSKANLSIAVNWAACYLDEKYPGIIFPAFDYGRATRTSARIAKFIPSLER